MAAPHGPAARYWGEEVEKDAIYQVYLRKVRYHAPEKPVQVRQNWDTLSQDSFSYLEWETVKERIIKAGTTEQLLNALITNNCEVDTKHFNVFFTTYRAFAQPADIAKLLIAKYEDIAHKPEDFPRRHDLLDTLRSILVCWQELFSIDFNDEKIVGLLLDFSRENLPHLRSVYTCSLRQMEQIHRRKDVSVRGSQKSISPRNISLLTSCEGLVDYLVDTQSSYRLPDLLTISAKYVSQQLTYWDSEVFKQLIPHQCMACFWQRRNKNAEVSTVRATVEQFNAITQKVVSSVLKPNVRAAVRARIIAKWIDVMKELRLLKNYSSLKALMSALTMEPVHRLSATWGSVPKEQLSEYYKLLGIFSGEENITNLRELMEKEATAKFVEKAIDKSKGHTARRGMKYTRSKSEMGEMQGAVPYLGTFLTDLIHIDSALQDTQNGLINFEKRRKEFQVLAQIKLFQLAAQNYHITPDPKFKVWFAQLPKLAEAECYEISFQIEPQTSASLRTPEHAANLKQLKHRRRSRFGSLGSIACALLESRSSSNSIADSIYGFQDCKTPVDSPVTPIKNGMSSPGNGRNHNSYSTPQKPKRSNHGASIWWCNTSWGQEAENGGVSYLFAPPMIPGTPGAVAHSRDSSVGDSGYISASHNSTVYATPERAFQTSVMDIADGTVSVRKYNTEPAATRIEKRNSFNRHSYDFDSTPDVYLVRVSLHPSLQSEITKTNMYKCVKLENSDKTYQVIQKAIEKHQLSGCESDYTLSQVLENGKIILPHKANAFYAICANNELKVVNCLLSPKNSSDCIINGQHANDHRDRKLRHVMPSLTRWNSGLL